MKWLRVVGLVILTVGGVYFTVALLFVSLMYASVMSRFGSEPVDPPSFLLQVLGVACFGFTAVTFGVGGLWQIVVTWLRDRKAKT